MVVTYTRRSAKVEHDLTLLEEAILLVQLDELEGGSGAVSLLFGELIPFVETALAVFLLDGHFDECAPIARCAESSMWIFATPPAE